MPSSPRGSTDLVTEADRRCEEIVAAVLRADFPSHAIIGEEGAGSGRYHLTEDPTWTIDAIDGTTNFVHRLALSCVLIALVVERRVRLAVTFDPHADELFWAVEGEGAHLVDRDGRTTRMRASNTSAMKQALVAMDPGYGRSDLAVRRYAAVQGGLLSRGVRGVRVLGCTGLAMAYVACDRLDAAFEEGSWRTGRGPKVWDFAPGALLVREAGGVTVDVATNDDDDDGAEADAAPPLTLSERPPLDLRGRSFFCAATPALAAEVLAAMDEACYRRRDLTAEETVHRLQDIVGTDAGGRGMRALVCPGDLLRAVQCLVYLEPGARVLVLSGFPCCVDADPPTETDGPPGAFAIARAAFALGHAATVITDDCNRAVFAAALDGLALPPSPRAVAPPSLWTFPASLSEEDRRSFDALSSSAKLVIACERAGPASDGSCRTMRGIDMNARGLIAPLHLFVERAHAAGVPFVAIGDGGNELGMGKVLDRVRASIPHGDATGCVVAADHLIAAGVSNWGAYALVAGAAVAKAAVDARVRRSRAVPLDAWVARCLPTAREETELLRRCVAAGCRDGVSGKVAVTVDGMPLERSLRCLENLRTTAMAAVLE